MTSLSPLQKEVLPSFESRAPRSIDHFVLEQFANASSGAGLTVPTINNDLGLVRKT